MILQQQPGTQTLQYTRLMKLFSGVIVSAFTLLPK